MAPLKTTKKKKVTQKESLWQTTCWMKSVLGQLSVMMIVLWLREMQQDLTAEESRKKGVISLSKGFFFLIWVLNILTALNLIDWDSVKGAFDSYSK